MDQINALVKEFEEARANNRAEWDSFSDDIKRQINGYNEKLAAHQLKQQEVEQRSKALEEKQTAYKLKHYEFEVAAKDKNVTNEEAVKMITDQQDRLLKRREEVEAKVANQQTEYERINADKVTIMADFDKFDAEETPKVQALATQREAAIAELNTMQTEVQTFIQNTNSAGEQVKAATDPQVQQDKQAEYIKMAAEAKEKQEKFNAKHQDYQKLEVDFKAAVAEHNSKKEVFQSRMAIVDKEVNNFGDMSEMINGQVAEVNEQIKLLVEKQKNFKDAASYLKGLSEDLKTNGEQLDKDIDAHNKHVAEYNASREDVLAYQKIVNDQIGNSQFKLKFHQDADTKIITEGQKKFAEMQAIIEKRMAESK